ncbi:MAG TPA: tetratricopeptide repeat protein [Thermoanaerobaculia bacterium]|nr:tetratricopeptide repeat protein [Thermoanaerobaculia bacterium]
MADPAAEARIRDLERRLDLDPGSRLFVSLADEYRKVGRVKDALSALQKGLLAHPGYVAAQVALGRTYMEANQATDAIATFTKVLVADPANLVAAKSLADIHLARNDHLEALKKYKLYRAISGDRKVDEMITKLEPLVAPKPVVPVRRAPEPPPPPPKFQETDKGRRRTVPKMPAASPAAAPTQLGDPFEITALPFELGDDSESSKSEDPFPFVPTRDVSLERPLGISAAPPPPPATPAPEPAPAPQLVEPPPLPPPRPMFIEAPPIEAASAPAPTAPPPEVLVSPEPPAPLPAPAPPEVSAASEPAEVPGAYEPPTEAVRPTGRALADLYYAQGHYAEALQIYDDLVVRHPFDEDLKRMRRDAEARLLPASTSPAAAAPDVGLERRLSRIRALKQWLSVVQAG